MSARPTVNEAPGAIDRGRVVLIHGTPLGPEIWDGVIGGLPDRDVTAPDCRRVPNEHPQTTLARAIAADIDGPFDVVGHSFGGQTAIELALLVPERVRTLTIMCSRDTPFPAFADTARALRAGASPAVDASLARWFTPAELADDGPAVQAARRELGDASVPDWAAALDAIATYDSSAETPTISVPTTILGAGLDRVSTPDAVTSMAHRIPGAAVEIRDDWAHMSPFAHLDELVPLLERSFARVR
jgi:pimeloyl-ACP methyl ester carboxylesterase